MKGMDGVALCAAIRNDPALDHLPVVLVSVDSSSAAKVRALEAGADAYLEKPLSVDYLDCQIRALIGIRGRAAPEILEDALPGHGWGCGEPFGQPFHGAGEPVCHG